MNILDIRGTYHPTRRQHRQFRRQSLRKDHRESQRLQVSCENFHLAGCAPGHIIEYNYREQSDSHYYINESWTITSHLFTRDARFTIRPDADATTRQMYYRQYGLPVGSVPVKQTNGTYAMDVHNIPGLEAEDYMPPARVLQARVDFYYLSSSEPRNETPDKFWNRKGKTWSEELDHFVNKKSALESD